MIFLITKTKTMIAFGNSSSSIVYLHTCSEMQRWRLRLYNCYCSSIETALRYSQLLTRCTLLLHFCCVYYHYTNQQGDAGVEEEIRRAPKKVVTHYSFSKTFCILTYTSVLLASNNSLAAHTCTLCYIHPSHCTTTNLTLCQHFTSKHAVIDDVLHQC